MRIKKILKYSIVICLGYVIRLIIGSVYLYNVSPSKINEEINGLEYYFEFDYFKERDAIIYDENLVIQVDYSKVKSLGVKSQQSYNPVTIGFVGLRIMQEYLKTGNDTLKPYLKAQGDWLIDNINEDGAWEINHKKSIENQVLEPGWVSALSQGFGISYLVRLSKVLKNENYLIIARKAIKPFKNYIEDGGVAFKSDYGVIYEEYPINKPDHVLNGFIYSLFGLYDLYRYDNNLDAKLLFDQGLRTLDTILPMYDIGNWSKYSLNETSNFKNHWNYASPFYQKIHVCQMDGLYKISSNEVYLNYKEIFEEENKSSIVNWLIYPAYVIYTDFVYIYKFFN